MNIDMIRAAALRAEGKVRRTPLLRAPFLDRIAKRRVWVKPECLQITGSFKFRGAWSAISALDEDARNRGVIAYSSGNHAQAVAHAAGLHMVQATIVMPSDAPAIKIANTKRYGAHVITYDRATESREKIGQRIAKEKGLTLIAPYDDQHVIAGQGTCGLEIAAQASEVGITAADVLVCCGGGGFTAGVALALHDHGRGLRARPVEPEGFDDVTRSLRERTILRNKSLSGGIWDAILTPQPGNLTFPIMSRLCGPGIVVSQEATYRAMAAAFHHLKLVAEPGGVVALAAALYHADTIEGEDVIVVISGGNVDPDTFRRALDDTP